MMNKLKHRRFGVLLGIPIGILLGFVICFFLFDDFWVYAQLLLFRQNDATDTDTWQRDTSVLGGLQSAGDQDYTGLGGGIVGGNYLSPWSYAPGEAGVAMVLANQMLGGYNTDWLKIAYNHVTWEYMSDAVAPASVNGSPIYPNILMMIGTALAEAGWGSSPEFNAPTMIQLANYGQTVDGTIFDLFHIDSTLLGNNPDLIAPGYDKSTLKHGSYYTNWQFTQNFASIYPGGAFTSTSAKYPSKMYTANMSDTDHRTVAQTDAAFFPDQVSIVLQSAWNRAVASVDLSTVDPTMLNYVSYAAHNVGAFYFMWGAGGRAGTDYTWGYSHAGAAVNKEFGADCTSLNPLNGTLTYKQLGSEAVNALKPLIEGCQEYLLNSISLQDGKLVNPTNFSFLNHTDYEGLCVMALLAGGDGFIATQASLDRLKSRVDVDAWMRGALIGYRVGANRPDASLEEVINFINNIKLEPVDESFYGPAYEGKHFTSSGIHEIVVHVYAKDRQVYNQSGQGPRACLRAYNSEALRGVFMTAIGGPYIYWRMLMVAGVACTPMQAFMDAIGGSAISTTLLIKDSYYSDYTLQWFAADGYDIRCNSPVYYRRSGNEVHGGEDYADPNGIPMYAVGNGTVSTAVKDPTLSSYGNYVIYDLDCMEGEPQVSILYAHMKSVSVSKGDRVVEGQTEIGIMGSTGNSGGTHLHIEVRVSYNGTSYRVPYGAVCVSKFHLFPVQYSPTYLYTGGQGSCKVYLWDGSNYVLTAAYGLTGDFAMYNGLTDIHDMTKTSFPNNGDYTSFGVLMWKQAALDNMAAQGIPSYEQAHPSS